MTSALRAIFRRATAPVVDRCAGGLHAGTVVKGLYLRWTLRPVLVGATGRVLDAGCGPGASFTRVLARRRPGWRFVGVDLVVREPRRAPPNVKLCVGDLRALPIAGPFDVVYSIDVLEHVEEPWQLVADLAAVLRPGGVLYLHVPGQTQRHFLPGVDREYSWLGPPDPGDVHLFEGFDRTRLLGWLQDAGCDVLASRCTFGAPVAILKELFMLGERARVPAIGLLLLPLVTLATWLEWRWGGRRGNGVLVLARRRIA